MRKIEETSKSQMLTARLVNLLVPVIVHDNTKTYRGCNIRIDDTCYAKKKQSNCQWWQHGIINRHRLLYAPNLIDGKIVTVSIQHSKWGRGWACSKTLTQLQPMFGTYKRRIKPWQATICCTKTKNQHTVLDTQVNHIWTYPDCLYFRFYSDDFLGDQHNGHGIRRH